MNLEQINLRKIMVPFSLVVAIVAAIFNIGTVASYLFSFIGVFNPFIVGLAIAYFINVFMVIIERRLNGRFGKYERLVSFGLTVFLLVAILTFVLLNVIPNLVVSIKEMVDNIQGIDESFRQFLVANQDLLARWNIQVPDLNIDFDAFVTTIQNNYETLLSGFSTYASKAIGGFSTFFIGLFFSIYLILFKEKLLCQLRRVMYAFLAEKQVDGILAVATLTNRTFASFITGQCLEALILGVMFTVSMSLLHLPYALLVGSLVSVMALIPIVGAFVSFLIGFFLILLVDVNQALIFTGLYLVLQQVEGNLIYPNVVGNSVGLPSIWTFASVVVGGSLFGVIGMFIMIPLVSVAYALVKEAVNKRQQIKQVDERKFLIKPSPAKSEVPNENDEN